ncbi:MAG: DUF11 domain-containing protein [Acidobacteria bacterium]|nr:DUF11 domain-containing protein [Acidobacteriota bacterium]
MGSTSFSRHLMRVLVLCFILTPLTCLPLLQRQITTSASLPLAGSTTPKGNQPWPAPYKKKDITQGTDKSPRLSTSRGSSKPPATSFWRIPGVFKTAAGRGPLFAPIISATKVDSLITDNDSDTLVDPGDTLRYTITINNTGSDATGLGLTDTISANTTLVGGSVEVSPVAIDDTYAAVGNVRIQVPAGSGVLANDFLGTPTATLTGGTFTSTNGGNVTLNTDGSFSYNPPAGFEGTDTFNYTVTNAVGSNTGSVSITVSGMIWFINNALGSAGDGRLTSPFNSLSAFAAINNGTGSNPAANDNIFLFTGSGAYSATLTLLNGQKLIGQGADATLASITGLTPPSFSDAFPTTNGTDPTLTSSGVTVTLAQNNRIQGLTLGNATTTDISGAGFGTLTLDDTTLNGTGGALTLSNGTLAATFDGISSTNAPTSGIAFSSNVIGSLSSPSTTITNPTQSGISIASSASGTFSFGNTALNMSGSTALSSTGSAATVNFQDLDIAPDSGVSAIGVSTFTGTLTSTTGTIACSNVQAISIAGTSSASRANLNMVLTSVSTSSATNGITLTNVAKASGATNSFTITGDGGGSNNASGGTITGSGSSNAGITLTSVNDVSLGYLSIQNSGTDGILATSCQNFSLARTNITDNTGTTSDEGIQFDNVSGTVSISNCSVTSSPHNHFFLDNDSGTLSSLSISNSTFDTTLSGTGNHGILVDANGTAVITTMAITNCTVSNNFSIGMQILSNGSASINGCNISGNTITTNTLAADLSLSSAANFTYDFNNNPTIRNRAGNGSHGLNTFQGCPSSGTLQGKIRNNTIGQAGVKESGSAVGNGIRVNMNGAGTSQVEVTNNIIREVPNARGIEVIRRSGNTMDPACNNTTGLHKITITGNTIAAPTGGTDIPGCPCPLAGIYVESRDQKSLCAKISGNTSYNPASFPAGFEEAYTLAENGTSVFSLEGTQATASAQISTTNTGTPVNASAGISVVAAGTCGPALPRPDGSSTTEPNQTVDDGGQNHLRVWRDGGDRDKVRQVTQEELDTLKAAAISRWTTADIPAAVLEKMRNVTVSLGDLPIGIIAINDLQSIVVDYSAAGYGWFVDSSPLGDEEFQRVGSSQLYVARPNTPAFRKADLLTVIMRQLGHIAGLKVLRGDRFKDQLMANMFFESIRRLPDASFDDLRRLTTEEAKVYAPASASQTSTPLLALGSSGWAIGQMTSVLPVFLKKTADASPTFAAQFGAFAPELKKAVRVIPATSDITEATPSFLPPVSTDDLDSQKGTQRNRPPQSRVAINPLAGETVNQTIGTLPGGESVIIRFNVTVNNPLPTPQISPSQPAVTQVLNQGTVSGSNFSNVLTDDPDIAGAANPTTTAINQTTTVVTSSANPAGQGQSVTFTATVTGTGFQPPNGANVRFFDGTTLLGSGTLTSGIATFATSSLTIGDHNIVAVYDGAAGSNGSISNTLVQRILMPPQVSKAFAAPTMPLNGTTTLTITITNPNTVDALTGVSVTDVLPAGLTVTDSSTSQCGGTLTTTAATSTISLTGATVAANGSCILNVTVTATTAGVKNNVTGNVNSTNGGQGNTASASITVLSPPSISKAFGASTIPLNGTTTLTFTLTNPNPSNSLTGVAFTDTLPAGLQVASTPNVVGACSGSVTAVAGSNSISLSGGSISASGNCTISVDVTGTTAGLKNNTTGNVTSSNGGTGNTASASITVLAPPTLAKSFTPNQIPLTGTSTLTFTITNPNASNSLSGISFTDSLPAGVEVAATPNVVNNCGATITGATAGSTSLNISTVTVAGGANCTISVDVTGTTAGVKTNTTGTITSTEGGTGTTATATLTVVAPPQISKAFGAATIPLNGTTTLTFTVTNPNSTVALSGIAFSDSLPAGLVVATPPNVTGVCGGTVTAVAGSGSISLSGGSLAAGGNCTISVDVTGTTAGTKNNVTGNVTATTPAGLPNGNTASASIRVLAPPSIAKAFSPDTIAVNGTTTLTFTLTNSNPSDSLTGVAFTDNLPAGVQVAGTPNISNGCTGTVTATAGSTTISLSGGTISASGNCTISVDVTGTTSGVKTNTTGNVTSTNGGTGNTATATLTVASPPTLTKSFTPNQIPVGGVSTLSFTITNPNAGLTLNNISLSDTFPAGIEIDATPNVVNSCGGTVTATPGTTSFSLSGVTLAGGASCTITVNVRGTTAGVKLNTTGNISSTESGAGSTASATLTVVGPATLTKTFTPDSIALNGTSTLGFTVANNNPTVGLTSISFTDVLPAGLSVSDGVFNNVCGAGSVLTVTAATRTITLTGGSVAAAGSANFNVTVTGIAAGAHVNTTGNISSTEGGTGGTATDTINVFAPPTVTKSFSPNSIPLNGTTTLTITFTNPAANPGGLTGIGIVDNLPAGLEVDTTPGANTTCGGTWNPTAGATTLTFSGGAIASPGGTCSISVTLRATTAGVKVNTTNNVTSTEGGTGGTASDTLSVAAPPGFTKAFGVSILPLNATTTLTFSITNANATIGLTGVSFTDTLPAGLVVATPPNLTGGCGSGTISATAGSGTISLTNGVIDPAGNCSFSVNVTGTTIGVKNNTTGTITTTEGGTGGTASDTVTVVGPPTISKAFGAATIPLNGTTSLTFTLTNPNTTVALSGIVFTDSLPAGLVVASTPNVTGVCGGTVTAVAGSSTISLSGGSLAAGGNCTISVDVTGTTAGVKNNTSGNVTATTPAGLPNGNTANASITVVAPPAISKAFAQPAIGLNTSTTLTFTITNPNLTEPLTGVAFTDNLPAGLVVATPANIVGVCSGSVTAVAGSGTISLSGGSILANSSCTISVDVTGTTVGTKNNTTGNVTSTNGGTGNTASATLMVAMPPTLSKAFGVSILPLNGTTTLTFTIGNPNLAQTLNGIAFTDTLPAGVVVAATPGASSTCGGTITAVAGTDTISFSGGSLAGNGTCTVTVNVTGTTIGVKNNTTGNVSSTESGPGLTASASMTVVGPPSITKDFGALTIPLNGSTTLSFTITNPNQTVGLSGIAFSDSLPAGLVVATPANIVGVCSGSVTAVAGSGTISLSGGSLAAAGSCTITVDVTGTTAGAKNNTTGTVTASNPAGLPAGNTASDSITVVAPPSISKAFTQSNIPLNGTTTLTFTITNPNTTEPLNSIAFTDTLPAGLVVAATPNVVGACSGTVTAVAGSNSISLSGGSIVASGNCTISVDVTGTTEGVKNNVTGNVTSSNGGTGNTASATVTVAAPPTISKAFGAPTIALDGSTTLTFTITNPNTTVPLTGVSFTDSLPAGLVVATPPNVTGVCSGTVTAVAGSSTISLSGGSLTAGGNCTITVNVTGTTAGVKNNTTGNVSSTQSGAGGTASASITVVAPASISKAFSAPTIPLNGSTTLTFTITNPNTTEALTGVAFSDTLPAGMVVASTPNITGVCGGTVTAVAGSGTISLSGGTIAASGNCTISVDVTGTTAGTKNNTTSAVTTTNGGTGNAGTATIRVLAPPSISKAFGAPNIPINGTTTLTFTLTNSNPSDALTGVAFTDTLPAGLQVASTPNVVGACSGTVTAVAGSNSISLSGGTIAASGNCTISVNVTGTTEGVKNNVTGTVSSTNGGTGNTASASLIVALPPTIGKAFGALTIPLGGTTTLTFSISNPNTTQTLNGISFTDLLPAGLVVATPPNISAVCSGTVTAVAGSSTISLSGGSLTAGNSCTIQVNVTGVAAGVQNNTTGNIQSTQGGTGGTASASITVVAPAVASKAFAVDTIPLGGTTTLTFTITNPNTTESLTGVGLVDNLPAGLTIADGSNSACGGTVTTSATNNRVTLTGATIAPGGTCTFNVTVTGATAGVKNNVSNAVTSTNGGTGNTAPDTITVVAPPVIAKVFNPATVLLNETTTLVFTLTNPNATEALTGVAFTDNLPAGLTVATTPAIVNGCGGTVTVVAGSSVITFTGGTIAANGNCTISVDVTASLPGTITNTTGAVSSTNGGTGNTATATLQVNATELSYLYVADTQNHRIQRYDGTSWVVLLGTGAPGSGSTSLSLPEAVTANFEATRIYVADTGNNRVQYTTNSGTTWATLASNGIGLSNVKSPQGVALDVLGNLYVADTGNNRVLRFNNGTPGPAVVLATSGVGGGQVRSPRGIAVDVNFNLYITDRDNNRVIKITNCNTVGTPNTGTTFVAGPGSGSSQVRNPEGVAVDNFSNVYVADTGNSRVLAYPGGNPAAATVMTTGTGSSMGQVNKPEGVTICRFETGTFAGQSFMAVGDTSNNRIVGQLLAGGAWSLVGIPNNLGSGTGQFRSPSKIR